MCIIFLALVVAQDLTDYVYWHFPNPHPFAFLKQVFLYSADTGIVQRFLQFFLRKIILAFKISFLIFCRYRYLLKISTICFTKDHFVQRSIYD